MTGSEGLIGRAVRKALPALGIDVLGCDFRADDPAEKFDFRNTEKLRGALKNCDGVLHLGALSRVVWGEMYPDLCRDINVEGMRIMTKAIAESPRKIWMIYASSREIYGTPPTLPCVPETPPNPENLYARTKYMGEKMMLDLRAGGVCTAIVRFSNVFGWTGDYHDRVVPAFAKAAANGGVLKVRGGDGTYDFTPLSDTVNAVVRTVQAISSGVCNMPPIDVVTGRATSLLELARMAQAHGGGEIIIEERQSFYPAYYQGDPRPAKAILGWESVEPLEHAIKTFVNDFKNQGKTGHVSGSSLWVTAAL